MRTALRLASGMAAVLLVAACASQPPPCPNGQQRLHTAQLFFGQNATPANVSEADFLKFVDEELTPRFPDGLTVLDGGGQWRSPEDKLIREASKVVLIVLPQHGDAIGRIEAARAAYKARFHQDSVLLITQPACVSF
jgi:hypothetical protein